MKTALKILGIMGGTFWVFEGIISGGSSSAGVQTAGAGIIVLTMTILLIKDGITKKRSFIYTLVLFVALIIGMMWRKSGENVNENNFLAAVGGVSTFVAFILALITSFIGSNTIICPQCAEPIKKGAKKCKHCGSEIS